MWGQKNMSWMIEFWVCQKLQFLHSGFLTCAIFWIGQSSMTYPIESLAVGRPYLTSEFRRTNTRFEYLSTTSIQIYRPECMGKILTQRFSHEKLGSNSHIEIVWELLYWINSYICIDKTDHVRIRMINRPEILFLTHDKKWPYSWVDLYRSKCAMRVPATPHRNISSIGAQCTEIEYVHSWQLDLVRLWCNWKKSSASTKIRCTGFSSKGLVNSTNYWNLSIDVVIDSNKTPTGHLMVNT